MEEKMAFLVEAAAMRKFLERLNSEPNKEEFEKTPDGKAQYLPISFVEMTLDELFLGLWSTENFKWSALGNEVQGSLELVCTHPVTGSTLRRTGAGSVVITVDALSDEEKKTMTAQDRNKHALDPANKKPNALDLAFPKLKAECVKNAAQTLGKVFGRDVNRKKKDVFNSAKVPLNDESFKACLARLNKGASLSKLLGDVQVFFEVTEQQMKEMENLVANLGKPEKPVMQLQGGTK